jgi:hypothetical protein
MIWIDQLFVQPQSNFSATDSFVGGHHGSE